jgi:predicted RNase H-like HicB family nuclease
MDKNMYYIFLTIILEKQNSDHWTVECRELGTATFGNSIEDARSKIEEAICLHLNTLEEVGERERFFKENKIKLHTKQPTSIKVDVSTNPRTFVQSYIQQLNPVGGVCQQLHPFAGVC